MHQKFGALPQKFGIPKALKFWLDFGQLHGLIVNILQQAMRYC